MSALVSLLRVRATVAWLVLIGATLISWWLGTDHGRSSGDGHRTASVVIILVAFLKVRLVGLYFMELRDSPAVLRLIFEGYCAAVCALVIAMYLAA